MVDDLGLARAVVAVLGTALGAYGIGQMVRGRRARRHGEDQKRLISAGVANLLAGTAVWVLVFIYSESIHRFGEVAGPLAFVAYLMLLALSWLIRHRRRKQLAGASQNG